jgi:hypothetical protein
MAPINAEKLMKSAEDTAMFCLGWGGICPTFKPEPGGETSRGGWAGLEFSAPIFVKIYLINYKHIFKRVLINCNLIETL